MLSQELLNTVQVLLQKNNLRFNTQCEISTVVGGDINTSYLLTDANSQYFLKTLAGDNASNMHKAEAFALEQLAAAQVIGVPRVLALGHHQNTSLLILTAINLHGPRQWGRLGAAIASLHQIHQTEFGWPEHNFIGRSQQLNTRHNQWQHFWWQSRLLPQIELACDNGFALSLRPLVADIEAANQILLEHHQPPPSLLHGDLWCGNIGFLADGLPVIFDPACYYGDREVDIALTLLFGGFGNDFYLTYQSVYPLPPGHQQRADLYNLYHLLNHLNLFGGSYLDQCLQNIHQLIAITSSHP